MPAIEVDGLTKRFGDLVAVDDIVFQVPKGSVYGFLGPNGSGKTTSLGMLTGLIAPDQGTARIMGHDVGSERPAALASVGAMVEAPAFYPHLSGRRNLQVVAPLVGADESAVERELGRMGLVERADAKYAGYSQGMRRRLSLAAALLGDPAVLVLDEPTNGLDPAGQQEVRRLLAALAGEGRTVLLSSHQLGEVQAVCSHVAILSHGRVVADGPLDDVLAVQDVLEVDVDDVDRAGGVVAALGFEADAGKGTLTVHAPRTDAPAINRALVEAGIDVLRLVPREGVLEQRFFELTEAA